MIAIETTINQSSNDEDKSMIVLWNSFVFDGY